MHNSKWKKILIILSVISLVLSISHKVFGAYLLPGLNDITYTLPDNFSNFQYIVIFRNSSNEMSALVSNTEIVTNNTTVNGNARVSVGLKTTGYYSVAYRPLNNTDFSTSTSIYENERTVYSSTYKLAVFAHVIPSQFQVYACNFDLKNVNGDIIQNNTSFTKPYFSTPTTEIENLQFSKLFVSLGSYSSTDNLYLHSLTINQSVIDDNNTYYYYTDNVITLNNKSNYYTQFLDSDEYYYSIPKNIFNFNTNTRYILLLNNSSQPFTNSVGIIDKNYNNNIYDLVNIDTSNILTSTDVTNNKLQNIDDTLNQNNVTDDTNTIIDNSLQFDNNNEQLNDKNFGFFSRLTTLISSLTGYNLAEDTIVRIPYPHSTKFLELHSNILYLYVTGGIRLIINAFWFYLFSFYMYKFINKLYIALSTGNILDTFSSKDEAITNNML